MESMYIRKTVIFSEVFIIIVVCFPYFRYDVHPDVPLGIKGIVAAIYEPPQVFIQFFYIVTTSCHYKCYSNYFIVFIFRNLHVTRYACCPIQTSPLWISWQLS
jgi:hypothetical protein